MLSDVTVVSKFTGTTGASFQLRTGRNSSGPKSANVLLRSLRRRFNITATTTTNTSTTPPTDVEAAIAIVVSSSPELLDPESLSSISSLSVSFFGASSLSMIPRSSSITSQSPPSLQKSVMHSLSHVPSPSLLSHSSEHVQSLPSSQYSVIQSASHFPSPALLTHSSEQLQSYPSYSQMSVLHSSSQIPSSFFSTQHVVEHRQSPPSSSQKVLLLHS